jgi:predicted O-methyltransferase YrrM
MEKTLVQKITAEVDGWLSLKEGRLLYDLAKNCTGKGCIVEIGSWMGKSTIWLANGSKAGNNVRIYAIDPHSNTTLENFNNNIKRANVDDIITPIVKKSEDAALLFDQPIELIFIDGDHEYDGVKKDFVVWYPKIIENGIMAFHDAGRTGWIGPTEVVDVYLYKSKNFKNCRFVNSITLGRKVNQTSISQRVANRINLLLRRTSSYIIQKLPFIQKLPSKKSNNYLLIS